ncbi:N-acetylmuramoyl-L-alanine amidase family protein [Polluticoccus soli]|uniref:N-acetylmuramoyl-L-alanine amidase family protein n=1 Tax=Polluticoccus soli TaxID=3034150 RepID=UPI0023E10135|nr:N-acetylmuramoyl-L-alanine amidase [Flavipsychrobacter sp. JY13-12]
MRTKLLLFIWACAMMPTLVLANGKKITKIVIDAGHGGTDNGARGKISAEKDLTLDVALRLGKMIQDSLPGVKVIYTRTTDIYPKLEERHEVANRSAADLFISIHVNATAARVERVHAGYKTVKKGKKKVKQAVYKTIRHTETAASGTETYVLGLHRSSQKEDAIGEYGEMVAQEPGMLDVNDPQTAIVVAQYASAFLSRSVSLGTKIQNEFSRQGRQDKGVKQMGLEVLAGSAMPGVLVEIGFINNPEEEIYLNSAAGQNEVTNAIFRGIRSYKAEVER